MKRLVSKRYPITSILNPERPYFNAASTDVERTMARAYAELERLKREEPQNVRPIRRKP